MLHRMPSYLKLAWRLGKDPMLSNARRAAVVAAAGYVISPVDLVPGVIPVLGQLDDIAFALAALRLALDGLHPDRRRMHLEAVGLEDAHLADDLRTVGATAAWIARRIRVSPAAWCARAPMSRRAAPRSRCARRCRSPAWRRAGRPGSVGWAADSPASARRTRLT